ncbi:unnamed protein product, partial [Didymodactylos carnosus]
TLREVLVEISPRLSDADRSSLAFLVGDDVLRWIEPNPNHNGILDLSESLFDRGIISNKNFTYLMEALEVIKSIFLWSCMKDA